MDELVVFDSHRVIHSILDTITTSGESLTHSEAILPRGRSMRMKRKKEFVSPLSHPSTNDRDIGIAPPSLKDSDNVSILVLIIIHCSIRGFFTIVVPSSHTFLLLSSLL